VAVGAGHLRLEYSAVIVDLLAVTADADAFAGLPVQETGPSARAVAGQWRPVVRIVTAYNL